MITWTCLIQTIILCTVVHHSGFLLSSDPLQPLCSRLQRHLSAYSQDLYGRKYIYWERLTRTEARVMWEWGKNDLGMRQERCGNEARMIWEWGCKYPLPLLNPQPKKCLLHVPSVDPCLLWLHNYALHILHIYPTEAIVSHCDIIPITFSGFVATVATSHRHAVCSCIHVVR